MNVAKLRNRLEFQERTVARGAEGGETETWFTVAFRWGAIVPLVGRELINAQQIATTVDHRIEIRFWKDLTAKMRIVFKGRTFGIDSVLNLEERKVEHHCFCTEQKAA